MLVAFGESEMQKAEPKFDRCTMTHGLQSCTLIFGSNFTVTAHRDDLLRKLFKRYRRLQHARHRLYVVRVARKFSRARILFRLRSSFLVAAGLRTEPSVGGKVWYLNDEYA